MLSLWVKFGVNIKKGVVKKRKYTLRPRKKSKLQDKKLKAIRVENRKSTTKIINKWVETGINVCYRIVRNQLNGMRLFNKPNKNQY